VDVLSDPNWRVTETKSDKPRDASTAPIVRRNIIMNMEFSDELKLFKEKKLINDSMIPSRVKSVIRKCLC
jgi:hypothetical protein